MNKSKNITGVELMSEYILGEISVSIFRERLKMKMSQKEFANYMKVPIKKVFSWESENYDFSIKEITYICDKLNLKLIIKIEGR